jgi:hypothetical protein
MNNIIVIAAMGLCGVELSCWIRMHLLMRGQFLRIAGTNFSKTSVLYISFVIEWNFHSREPAGQFLLDLAAGTCITMGHMAAHFPIQYLVSSSIPPSCIKHDLGSLQEPNSAPLS